MKTPIRCSASRSWFALSLVAGLAWLGAGCQRPDQGEFLSYRELDARQRTVDEPLALDANDAEDRAASDGRGSGPAVARTVVSPRTAVDDAGAVPAPEPPAAGANIPDWIDTPAGSGIEPGAVDEPAAVGETAGSTGTARSAADEAAIVAFGGAGPERTATNGSGGPNLADPAAPPSEPREIQLLVPEKTFKVEGPQGAIRVNYTDFDLLTVLNMEPVPTNAVDYFPSWLRELDGRRVRLRGFMFPDFLQEGLKGFVLARDNDICCFVRTPKPYDVLIVKMRDGLTTDYIANRPFDVVGTFRIKPFFLGDTLYSVYAIDDATVINK
ncbi:MAG: hypothetical protein WED34_09970 [Planctomycetales bacterium]